DDEAIYKQALEVTSKHGLIQHDTQRALLSFGLGLRAKAPAVEAQYSYYRDEVLGWQRGLLRKATAADPNANEQFDTGCRTWVQWKDRQACGIDEFKKIVETDSFYGDTYLEEPRIRPSKLELDHIFCNPAGGGERVVMYTDGDGIGEFHEYLSHLCEERGITYVLRFIPPAGHNNARRDLYLSGYGAEMKLKSTEYKVDDDRLVKGNGDQARKFVSDARAQRGLREQNIFNPTEEPAIRSLKPSKLSRLGIQAAQLILEAGHGNRTSMVVDNSLDMLAALSQDFPKYAHYIARTAVDPKYSKALKTLEEPSVADALFINGYRIAAHDVDPFNLFERIVAETKVAAELQGLGMNATQAQQIMTAPTPPVTPPGRAGDLVVAGEVFDVRDASEGGGIVMWLNDLERDSRYKSWPASLETLKQQYYGQLPRVRRNVAHVLFALDFSSPAGLDVFASVSNLVKNGFMMRVGFVPLVDRRDQNSAANAMARLYHYLHARHGLKAAVEFLTSVHEQVVKRRKAARDPRQLLAAVKAQFEQWAASNPQKDGDNVLEWSEIVRASDDDHDSDEFKDFIRRAGQFKRRLGLYTDHFSELGVTFINGRPVQMEGYFMGNLVDLYGQVCIEVAQLYQEHKITNETNIYDLLLDQPGVMRSRNPIVYPSETAPERFIDMCPIRRLIPPHMYFAPTSADQLLISLHVVGDLSTAAGRTAALNALVAASSRNDTRVAILHAESGEKSAKDGSAEEASGGLHVATLYQLLNRGSKFDRGVAIDLAISYLENPDNPTQRYLDHSGRPAKEAGRLAAELARLISEIGEDELEAATLFHRQAVEALRAAGAVVKPGAQTVVCNGRVLPPITHDNYFDQNAFVELIELELNPRIRNFNRVLRRAASDLAALEQYPDIVLCAASVVESATHSHQPHGLFKY
ncbi:killer toxin resistant protein, partial [Spiromyces aspiralis]